MLPALTRLHMRFEEGLRKELGKELKAECEKRGLKLLVVSRENPLELRIPPLSIIVELEKGRCEIRFAKDRIAECPMQGEKILKAWEGCMKRLDRPFDPGKFFDQCLAAYSRILRLKGLPPGSRIELSEFLPELAILLQPRSFLQNPKKENFRTYGKANFAYDVLRLKKANMLSKDGARMNFGVATGITAQKKGRVIYMEDEEGNGEYKLTIFFKKTE